MSSRRFGALLSVVAVALGVAIPALAHKNVVTRFTYYADILPLFREKCGSCHRDGGVAPMSLLSYKSAYPWAIAIKTEVLSLTMPPGFADERYGRFEGASGLAASEMDTIVDWCLGGAPEGEPLAALAPPVPAGGWSLGEPDAVLEPSAPVTLSASESETVRVLLLPTSFGEDRRLSAMDLRPGRASVVRSAVAEIVVGGEARLLGAWVAGRPPTRHPEAMGVPLPEGAKLRLTIRYTKTWLDEGQEVVDRSALGLYFAEPRARDVDTVALRPEGEPFSTGGFFALRGGQSLSADGELLAIVPKLGASLAALVVEAVRSDGSREVLLRLDSPTEDWTRSYRLEEPLHLKSGTRVELTLTAPERKRLTAQHTVWLQTTPN